MDITPQASPEPAVLVFAVFFPALTALSKDLGFVMTAVRGTLLLLLMIKSV